MIEHIGSLCSGYGGLDRALSALLRLPFGWHAEIEKLTDKHGKVTDNPVCELLTARYPGVPNHGDITAIDWASLARPRALAAGFPCQGVSSAGLQLGDLDARWLWPAVLAGIEALRPEWVAIENVANLVSIQSGRLWRGILADLAELGYSVAWGIFGACLAAVSGCHHRHRVFALARLSSTRQATRWAGKACGRCLPTAVSLLPTPRATDGSNGGPGQRGSSGDLAMPSAVQPQNFGRYAWAVDRWAGVHGPAPRPTEPGPRGGVRMAAAFPEWMMGLAPGFVTDILSRKAALHAIGNGVMPLQAYTAFRTLVDLLTA